MSEQQICNESQAIYHSAFSSHISYTQAEAYGSIEKAEHSLPEPKSAYVLASLKRAQQCIKDAQGLERQPPQAVEQSEKVPGIPESTEMFDDTGALERGV